MYEERIKRAYRDKELSTFQGISFLNNVEDSY